MINNLVQEQNGDSFLVFLILLMLLLSSLITSSPRLTIV